MPEPTVPVSWLSQDCTCGRDGVHWFDRDLVADLDRARRRRRWQRRLLLLARRLMRPSNDERFLRSMQWKQWNHRPDHAAAHQRSLALSMQFHAEDQGLRSLVLAQELLVAGDTMSAARAIAGAISHIEYATTRSTHWSRCSVRLDPRWIDDVISAWTPQQCADAVAADPDDAESAALLARWVSCRRSHIDDQLGDLAASLGARVPDVSPRRWLDWFAIGDPRIISQILDALERAPTESLAAALACSDDRIRLRAVTCLAHRGVASG